MQEFIIAYEENNTPYSFHFRCGYPAEKNNTSATFYEVLADGKQLNLLKKTSKIVVSHDEYGRGVEKEYRQTTQLYVYDVKKSRIWRIKKDISFLKTILPSFKKQLEHFASEHNFKINKEEDLVELITYLNAK